MTGAVTLSISILSLSVSIITVWLTLFRRGTVKMSQPTVIFFGPDGFDPRGNKSGPKIYLRTLLFSTSKRGRVVESMHVAVSRNETQQNFNIWVYGEQEKLVRGSGLFVGETGVAANHHFLTPKDGSSFHFTAGQYELKVFARLLGDKSSKMLFSQSLQISPEIEVSLKQGNAGLYFDWGPDSSRYLSHVENRPPPTSADGLLKTLGISLE